MRYIFIIFTAFVIIGYNAASQNFRATISKNPVVAGERFQLTYTLDADGSNFQGPTYKGFTYLGGPSQGQSISIVNGRMSKSLTFTYILQADDPDTYTIPAATIIVDGNRISSNTISITVLKADAGAQAQAQAQRNEQGQAEDVIKKNLFITLSLSKSEAYLGEPLVATYKLYKHPNLTLVNLTNPQSSLNTGFWSQDLETGNNIQWVNETANGVNYQAAVIKKMMLIPQRSGNLDIEQMELDAIVRLRIERPRGSRSMFDDFFDNPFSMGSVKDFDYKLKSRSGSIKVKPLPDGAPIEFAGAVGNLSMKAWFDKTKTRTNEPVTLKVQISGGGNLKLVDPPNLMFPSDFDTYETKIADNLSATQTGFSGNKTFEYLLIPRHSGHFDIEPVVFAYFDLSTKRYVTLTSDAFTIEVEKGESGEASGVISGVTKENIKYLGKDILFIKTSNVNIGKRGDGFFLSTIYAALGLSPIFLFILFFLVRRKTIAERRNQALMLNRKASKNARKRLSVAKDYMKSERRDKFYEEVTQALWGYLSSKLNIPYADLSKDTAKVHLASKQVSDELIENALSTIDECEYARFAPSDGAGEMENMYNRAALVITKIESSLK